MEDRDLELVFGVIVAEGLDRAHDEGKKAGSAADLENDVARGGLDGAGRHLEAALEINDVGEDAVKEGMRFVRRHAQARGSLEEL